MITGASQMDAAILLVDATQGPQTQTREHVLLARQVGVEHVVAFVNKVDVADPELLDLVKVETAEVLDAQGYAGTPIVCGSPLCALEALRAGRSGDQATDCIRELVAALDEHVPDPERDVDSPFLMTVDGVHSIPGRGTVVTGRVTRGVVRTGDSLEIVGLAGADGEARGVV
jgi:elongation factor Tu